MNELKFTYLNKLHLRSMWGVLSRNLFGILVQQTASARCSLLPSARYEACLLSTALHRFLAGQYAYFSAHLSPSDHWHSEDFPEFLRTDSF